MDIINLSIFQLLFALIIPLLTIFLSKLLHVGKESDIIKSCTRMVIQLFILGYVLVILLYQLPGYIGSLYIFIMLAFAIITFKQRVKGLSKDIVTSASIAMIIGSLTLLGYFIFVVVRPTPILNAQYIIPVYGMILGNTLTGITLGAKTLVDVLETKRSEIETMTNLGVASNVAIRPVFSKTLEIAITPILTTVSAMGLVSLPGMLTGQILGGVDPLIAVKYQMAMMFTIFGSVFISNIILIIVMRKKLINEYGQIKYYERS